MNGLIIAVIVVVVVVVAVILYKLLWRVAGPNEVLVVSRRRDVGNPELAPRSGLRVVTGRGALVKPGRGERTPQDQGGRRLRGQ